jgi:hypothetical protein
MNISSATPKQVAYLTYMGVRDAERMSKDEASAAIEKLFDTADDKLWERLREKQTDWITDRFILYPDLYAHEIQSMLDHELPEMFHAFVRSRVVGASETLTKAKIKHVIDALTRENKHWWQAKNKKDVFFTRLAATFPGCVDGRPPEKKVVPAKQPPPQVTVSSRRSGCMSVVCALVAATVICLLIFA